MRGGGGEEKELTIQEYMISSKNCKYLGLRFS